MKNTRKMIISAVCLYTALASITGCSNSANNNESVETTAPIYVQEDEYQYGNDTSDASDTSGTSSNAESEPTTSNEPVSTSGSDAGENKPHVIAENETSSFELPADKAYNTSLKPNVADDVSFQVELTYTEDFSTDTPRVVATEVLPLTATTTYADICNLDNFSLVTVDGDMAIEEDKNGQFDYYGIMHTTANSPATYTIGTDTLSVSPTINLELVENESIVTNASSLISTNDTIRVKAISAKSVAYNSKSQGRATPVMLSFAVSLSGQEPSQYEIGMSWSSAFQSLKKQGIIPSDFKTEDFYIGNAKDYLILKNTDYTLVFAKEGSIVGSISLIKN